jgi:hypothetical protein
MRSSYKKLIALCLAGLLLLAPVGQVLAAVATASTQDYAMQSADGASHCPGCFQSKARHDTCCQGADCALSSCAACVAAFHAVRIPVRVAICGSPVSAVVAFSSSYDPDLLLRPPRA